MTNNIYRYMGVKPFEAANRAIFFGRDEDIDSLYNLILSEKLTVLFGKSGYGKSSLLNAGVLPLFRKDDAVVDDDDANAYHATVVEIRLGSYTEDKTLSPIDTVQAKLEEKIKLDSGLVKILSFGTGNNMAINIESPPNLTSASVKSENTEGGSFLDTFYPSESSRPLWYHFKRRQNASEAGRFIVVFDQFEEFFTYPVAFQERFKRELAELLYSDIPQTIRKRLNELAPTEKRLLAQVMDVKAVFAIRADRMSFLDTLKDALPAILHKRYELRPLTPEQAREAIVTPAGLTEKKLVEKGFKNIGFITPTFEYTEGALAKITRELSSERNGSQAAGIEAFQLQILCQYIESQIESGKIQDIDNNGMPDVTVDDLPDMSNLYTTYYRRQLDRLDSSVRRAAQVVLEEGLLAEDLQTGDA